MKRGEKRALATLRPAVLPHVAPLLEPVEFTGKRTIHEHIRLSAEQLEEVTASLPCVLIDPHEIARHSDAHAAAVLAACSERVPNAIPVLRLRSGALARTAHVCARGGMALRLELHELLSGDIAQRVGSLVTEAKLDKDNLDLLIDLGSVDDLIPSGVSEAVRQVAAAVQAMSPCRSVAVISSSWPKRLEVDRHGSAEIARSNWTVWRDELRVQPLGPLGTPAFGDMCIQHPDGVEGFDPKKMAVSATVRYATEDHWIIVKGESTKRVPAKQQFPILAERLIEEHADRFDGSAHCQGCEDIVRTARGASGCGNAEAWRRIGTCHHITKTVESLNRVIET